MRNGRRANAETSGEIFLEPWIGSVDEFMGGSVEDDLAFIQDEKPRAVIDPVVGNLFYLSGLLVEAISGQEEGVLQAMSNDQRRCVGNVALLDDEIDDGS